VHSAVPRFQPQAGHRGIHHAMQAFIMHRAGESGTGQAVETLRQCSRCRWRVFWGCVDALQFGLRKQAGLRTVGVTSDRQQ